MSGLVLIILLFLAGGLLLENGVQQQLQAVLEVRQLDTAPTKIQELINFPTT